MFRVAKSIGAAVICAITALVAVPATSVSADANVEKDTVEVLYRGEPLETIGPYENGVLVEPGSSVNLNAATNFEGPTTYEWEILSDTPENPPTAQGPNITVQCGPVGLIDVKVVAQSTDGVHKATGFGAVYCFHGPITWLTPGEPINRTRKVIKLGARLTFESTPLTPDVPTEWRSTGSKSPTKARRYERTFDKPGNFGVEVTAQTADGPLKQWVGFTVVGPPTVSVSPAPANPKDRMPVALDSTVTFDGSGSRSADPNLQYEWRVSGSSAVVGRDATYTRKFGQLGNIGVELTVIDSAGQRAKRWVGISVFEFKAPVVSVTPAPPNPKVRTKVKLGTETTFNASASIDPDGGDLTFEWRTTGVRGVASPSSTFTRRFDKVGNVGVEVTVIDDEGQRSKLWIGYTVVR